MFCTTRVRSSGWASLCCAAVLCTAGSVAAQPTILPGHYLGTWNNTTFASTGAVKADVFVKNGIVTIVFDAAGSVFGQGDPGPVLISGPLTAGGVAMSLTNHPLLGNATFNIGPTGTVTCNGTAVPAPNVDTFTANGSLTGATLSLSGTIGLTGGGTANTTIVLNRSVLSTIASPNQIGTGIFGYAVCGIGDIDGDGRGDAVVGAPLENPDNYPEAGRAYFVSGATGNVIRTLISPGREAGGHFGVSVAAIPDVNGDGKPDVVIGAPDEDPGTNPSDTGRAYIYSGATGGLLWKLIPPAPTINMHFGKAVAGVPDVNGDGRGDVLVGAPDETYAGGQTRAGRVYVYSGATGVRIRNITPPTPQANDFFGRSVAGLADINNDGRGDIVIGAPENEDTYSTGRTGHAYLFSGSTGGFIRQFNSPAAEANGRFGYSIAAVADTNGDGKQDIVIGGPFENPGASPVDCGRAHLYSGATGALLFKLLPPTPAANGRFGWSLAGVPDINGDARGDIVVGAPGEPTGAGRAHTYSGATGGRLSSHASAYAEAGGNFGWSVGGTPDLSGNGRGDLIVGAWKENPPTLPVPPTDTGRAYIVRR